MKKNIQYLIVAIFGLGFFASCEEDSINKIGGGDPQMTITNLGTTAFFADSLPFTVDCSDNIPLSTLKAKLYFDDVMVSETVFRTKQNKAYSGKINVPYLKDIPNGNATLKFVLQNIQQKLVEEIKTIAVSRPDYPSLNFVSGDATYTMSRTALYQYTANDEAFLSKMPGYIVAPAYGANGNELTFGWKSGTVAVGEMGNIPFSNLTSGSYDIQFNTMSFIANPFVVVKIADKEMSLVDNDSYEIEMDLTQGQELSFFGFPEFESWWMDVDFFKSTDASDKFKFLPISGKYRITAYFDKKYFRVEAMDGDNTASLQPDGTGALWIIGTDIGKPSVALNQVGWNPNNAICMAQLNPKKYQVTVVAGTSISSEGINFKFFHQKNWGGEFKSPDLTSDSDIIFVGDGEQLNYKGEKRDPGNLGLKTGPLQVGKSYLLEVSVESNSSATLSVTLLD